MRFIILSSVGTNGSSTLTALSRNVNHRSGSFLLMLEASALFGDEVNSPQYSSESWLFVAAINLFGEVSSFTTVASDWLSSWSAFCEEET